MRYQIRDTFKTPLEILSLKHFLILQPLLGNIRFPQSLCILQFRLNLRITWTEHLRRLDVPQSIVVVLQFDVCLAASEHCSAVILLVLQHLVAQRKCIVPVVEFDFDERKAFAVHAIDGLQLGNHVLVFGYQLGHEEVKVSLSLFVATSSVYEVFLLERDFGSRFNAVKR